MRASLALIVLILNAAAILSILRTRSTAGRKVAWMAAVVLVPVAGALAWWGVGRRRSPEQSSGYVNGRIE